MVDFMAVVVEHAQTMVAMAERVSQGQLELFGERAERSHLQTQVMSNG
jgi:hypothetical protein